MKDCIFCTIVAGDIPNYTVYQDNHSLAFLDIHPHTKGHTVVIPKVHAETLLDLDEALIKELFKAVKRAQERIEEVLHPDGYTLGWNHGTAGGQVVPHLHIHIMPRWEGDGGGNIHSVINNSDGVKVEELAKLFV